MQYDDEIAGRLRATSVFEGLDQDGIRSLFRICHDRRLEAGEILFREGDAGRELFVVLDGRVGLRKEDRRGGRGWNVTELGPGAVLGEMALLTSDPRSLTAQALCECRLLVLPRSDFDRLTDEGRSTSARIFRNLAVVLSNRLARMNRELDRYFVERVAGDQRVGEALRLKDEILNEAEP